MLVHSILNTILMQAPAEGAQGGGNYQFLIMMVLLFGVMYLFMIRPQQKKQKEIRNFRSQLQKGDKVVTTGGIYGKIKVIINPELIKKRGDFYGYENCLSMPNHSSKIIQRPGFIRVRYTGLDNRQKELSAAKSYAALLAHEIDHLNGTLYIDH